ncbi:LysE family translocator [Parvularcula sp. ZS-1/3]|uniref:LysE family translocator n=1 Tax=Parvularcula mediterranea TaxID=2732508 RepID=A0A7Y3W659_9PROT|nr:LysE family translocator [Parvularcula mediterranea]NNU17510.1 LysE family translocator [Parvularcula mediterranea]
MSIELLLTFIAFAFTASITPGPNNLMMMASGSVFGFRKTLPHITGVVLGFAVLLSAMIAGLGLVLEGLPAITIGVQVIGAGWLFWLGLSLCLSAKDHSAVTRHIPSVTSARPFRAIEAALFQWANPKALAMTASCAAAFSALAPSVVLRLTVMVTVFSVIGALTSVLWTLVGCRLAKLLATGSSAYIAQLVMGLLFIATSIGLLIV